MTVVGAILGGGASRRFGSDKALAPADGVPLGARVRDALRGAGVDPIVYSGGVAGPSLGLVTVADRHPGDGPLVALATLLTWAGTGRVLVVPCDLPLLRSSDIVALLAADPGHDADRAVVATVDGRPQHTVAIWPAAWRRELHRRIAGGDRSLRTALEVGPWLGVELDALALADADTPAELDRLLALGRGSTGEA